MAASIAALILKIPIAHIHGGETTQGAFDEAIRHSISKMSRFRSKFTKVPNEEQVSDNAPRLVVTTSQPAAIDSIAAIQLVSGQMLG
mgnify:CR=1 FL=1